MTYRQDVVMRLRLFLGFVLAAFFCLLGTDRAIISVLDLVAEKFLPFRGRGE